MPGFCVGVARRNFDVPSVKRLSLGFALISLAVLAAWTPRQALAQGGEGRIYGTIIDPTGAVMPGVTILIKNDKTGEERTATTNDTGQYNAPNLKPSFYTVRASAPKFASSEFNNLQLLSGQGLAVDLALVPAGAEEIVTVTAEPPQVDLRSASMSANVNQREVDFLPVNGRQISQLYLQAPGALNTGTGTFGDIRFNGRANQQNEIRYDGVEGTAIIDASPGNLNGEIPSPFKLQTSLENVQEFRVDSNNFPAEYGTGTGGQITVVTKSGGNELNGTAFEYFRDDRLDDPNRFDPKDSNGNVLKSPLRQNQFGASVGGPIAKDRAFFFVSYEGYRLNSGINTIEAVPSDAARARAVPEIAPLIDAFRGPGAFIVPGASTNPDFDIAQLQSNATVKEDSFSLRFDFQPNGSNRFYARYFRDPGNNTQPEGVTGRNVVIKATPQNAVFGLQTLFSSALNDFKVGYNSADTEVNGVVPTVNGIDLSAATINITGSVANTGIAGQGSSSGVATPGGLVRQNSATNGRGAPYQPYSLSFIDNLSWTRGEHYIKVGGELRMIRLKTDRLGGTTYTFSNLNDFLANRAQQIQYLGDLSAPSPFNGGVATEREAEQQYYIGFIQDEWRVNSSLALNLGLRYEYYSPLHEKNNLDVVFNPATGTILPPDTPFYKATKMNFAPRASFIWSPSGSDGKTAIRGGFGIYVGPGQTEDQIQPIESDRVASSLAGGSYPIDPSSLDQAFINNPDNRQFQPRAYLRSPLPQYIVPEKVYQYSVSFERELPGGFAFTGAYVGSQGRNLFLRSVTNQITDVLTNPDPTKSALVIRQFDIVKGNTILKPYAEVDVKTSGGYDSYNAMQLSLARRFQKGITLNGQYTLGRSYGTSAGSNEAQTVGNNAVSLADFDYDLGYNRFDVRHTFNLSALFSLPFGSDKSVHMGGITNAILGNWDVGAILNARSGYPMDVFITRPDVVYVDGAGNVFSSAAADRTAVINTPGGGASRNVRRPDLVPGVDPYIGNGVQWLNPAAFAIPAPGTFGNLKRGDIRGPGFKQFDLMLNKRFVMGERSSVDARIEIFNLFNFDNYANPSGRLGNALGTGTNQLQPGQPYTQAASGSTFGVLTSTVGRTVGLGTNRQLQFAVRFNF
jgi:Carboxypeptidase regulatory-like domain